MKIAVIGLGRMGHAIAKRLVEAKHIVFGLDADAQAIDRAKKIGVQTVSAPTALPDNLDAVWLMLPAGLLIDRMLEDLSKTIVCDAVIIDGGNSNFKDSMRRAATLRLEGRTFLDCGTSGGLLGEQIGFSLMIGGDERAYTKMIPLFQAVAMKDGYGRIGPSGAGHYVKAVHNGIEYALLQAYAEGFHLIKEGSFKDAHIDLAQLSAIWEHGSIIRSYILDLAHHVFTHDQEFASVSGQIGENGTGKWALDDAVEHRIPAVMLEQALQIRAASRLTGGDYATKVVALLRHAFGGHSVERITKGKA